MSETTRRRIPTWLVALAAGLLGVALGAGVLSAQAQSDEPADPPTDRAAAIQAFRDCATAAGITLPDVRQHRRNRERLDDAERQAVADAREACGDLLPHAEERAAFRQCLTDAGVLDADGNRPDRSSLTDEERQALRDDVRTCAEAQGIERPMRCRPGRRHRPDA
jgi:hypothetical protein